MALKGGIYQLKGLHHVLVIYPTAQNKKWIAIAVGTLASATIGGLLTTATILITSQIVHEET